MILRELIKDSALVLCGHGSRDSNYFKDFQNLKTRLKQKSSYEIYDCFIEINKPSIEECISKIAKNYKKIIFFPLLLFDGKHMTKDVINKITALSKKYNKKILLVSKLSLLNDIFPIIKKIISDLNYRHHKILITSCSFSKSNKVIKELEEYTTKLSLSLGIKRAFFHFVGNENKILYELKKYKIRKVIIHPIFYFNGFLYKKNAANFSELFDTLEILPLSHYDEIIEALTVKLIRDFQTFN